MRKPALKVNQKSIAQIGDIILWKKHNLTLEVEKVRDESVVARFVTFPVKGREDEFEFDKTVINHRNYEIIPK